jgi:hypothetical protein
MVIVVIQVGERERTTLGSRNNEYGGGYCDQLCVGARRGGGGAL